MADEGASAPAADIDFSKKHPLEHTWTLWFDNPNGRQKLATFGKTLRPVYTFSTVEDFWWCVLPLAARFRRGSRRRDGVRTTTLLLPTSLKLTDAVRAAPAGGDGPTLGSAGLLFAPGTALVAARDLLLTWSTVPQFVQQHCRAQQVDSRHRLPPVQGTQQRRLPCSPAAACADLCCLDRHQEGIEPKWEDPKCARGGKWTFTVPKGNNKAALDTFWLHVVLALIGEQFADPGEVCGAVVNVRNRGDRICLWTRTGANEAAQLTIGKQMKHVLDLNDGTKLGYMLHEDAMQQDKNAKDRYII